MIIFLGNDYTIRIRHYRNKKFKNLFIDFPPTSSNLLTTFLLFRYNKDTLHAIFSIPQNAILHTNLKFKGMHPQQQQFFFFQQQIIFIFFFLFKYFIIISIIILFLSELHQQGSYNFVLSIIIFFFLEFVLLQSYFSTINFFCDFFFLSFFKRN